MAINFVQGQVAVSDPNPTGPSAISNIKDVNIKVVKLTSANFGTSAVNTLVAVLPADATIINMDLFVKTQLAGNSISAATINVGTASGGTQFVNGFNAFGTTGTSQRISPIAGIMQNYNVPLGSDIQVFVGGTATTGNPTSGELYMGIYYVR